MKLLSIATIAGDGVGHERGLGSHQRDPRCAHRHVRSGSHRDPDIRGGEGRCIVTRHPEGEADQDIRVADLGPGDGFGEDALDFRVRARGLAR